MIFVNRIEIQNDCLFYDSYFDENIYSYKVRLLIPQLAGQIIHVVCVAIDFTQGFAKILARIFSVIQTHPTPKIKHTVSKLKHKTQYHFIVYNIPNL